MKTAITLLEKPALWAGKFSAWLLLLMMFISCAVVGLRYGFNIGSLALQEAVNYCHAAAFLLGVAYTLQQDAHVRVDIFYQRFSRQQQAWVDALGCLVLLLPFALFLLYNSWFMFLSAWQIKESSAEPGGLPWLYLYKGFLPLATFLLIIQALAMLLRNVDILVFNSDTSSK